MASPGLGNNILDEGFPETSPLEAPPRGPGGPVLFFGNGPLSAMAAEEAGYGGGGRRGSLPLLRSCRRTGLFLKTSFCWSTGRDRTWDSEFMTILSFASRSPA